MDTRTPVLVLNCKLGGLAIMRSLGHLGIPVFGVDGESRSPGFLSRYCRGKLLRSYEEKEAVEYLELVLRIGEKLGGRSILIPTSDELSVFVAENLERLSTCCRFPEIDPDVVRGLISKKGMYGLALRHVVPTPLTLFPESLEDVHAFAKGVQFPVMLKGIHGNRLYARTGKKMVLSGSREELVKNYRALEDPEIPNLMIQEYIPGGDDQIYIFNGYFDGNSDCLAAFTGHKIRQYPVHVGCASLGICRWNQAVADTTIRFMKAIGYKGILDIGYRLDPRDRQYKVLDINPRVGQAFRLFLAVDGTDVVRTLYRDLTGQGTGPTIVPREGRRWLIEDYDIESSLEYFREGTLTFREWAASFRGVEEAAWFDWRDPFPFLWMCGNLSRKAGRWMWNQAFPRNAGGGRMRKSLKQGAKNALRAVLPLSLRRQIAIALHRVEWFEPESRYWWTRELLRDFAEREPASYHRFLWSNHLGYAATYNVEARFLKAKMPGSRRIFFSDLSANLRALGLDPGRDIRSVLEVGCSLGYQLQYMESAVFPGADELVGIDIDRLAVEQGMEHLGRTGSNVRLIADDMGQLDRVFDGQRYDVIVCTGVLMYLDETEATAVTAAMLRLCGNMVAISGPAHPDVDNALLDRAVPRNSDGSFFHNLDRIVEKAGGTVVARRYEGKRIVDGHTIYFVFARAGGLG